ncbi:hypothetical protein [Methanococcus maripaludis]|uniref:Uncharacterized protein n=1 Tax=Methanococcus maripaludis TaxID=39152 RepID=A0A7J9PTF6_METMI|nr:hypothetical protein [Methanococcus maripaludis]MBA2868857.1 hypothetical protein [Methanococcus maripaludis]
MLEILTSLTLREIHKIVFTGFLAFVFIYLSIKGPKNMAMPIKEFRMIQGVSLFSIVYVNWVI